MNREEVKAIEFEVVLAVRGSLVCYKRSQILKVLAVWYRGLEPLKACEANSVCGLLVGKIVRVR